MPFGWEFLRIAPPLVAIVLAITTRRVVPSLFFGVVAAALLVAYPQLFDASGQFAPSHLWSFLQSSAIHVGESFLWPSLADADHLRVIAFTMLMGAMVGVIHRSGGMRGIATMFAPLAKTRWGGQMATWLMGLVIFFDDYANALLVGNTMRPITDRLKISREKLAFIVDTTSAPIAGLALISTWVAGEMSYVDDGTQRVLAQYGEGALVGSTESFWIICQTIPYRFYMLFAIVFVPLLIVLRRDFGSMLTAERLACSGTVNSIHPAYALDHEEHPAAERGRWLNAVIPVVTMIAAVLALIVATGWASLQRDGKPATLWRAFPAGNSYVALLYGSLAGLFVAALVARLRGAATWSALRSAAAGGALTVIPALTILWLSWSLSLSTKEQFLDSAQFLSGLLNPVARPEWISPWLFETYQSLVSPYTMPTLVFVVAGVIAFATGTSWGTMAILTPLVVVVMYEMLAKLGGGGPVSMSHPLMLASVGSVLAGAIFGDHCSPISDTTVLSSQASNCNHIAHVQTQMTYAITVALVSILAGTLLVGWGLNVWLALILGCGVLLAVIWFFGKDPEASSSTNP